MSDERKLSPPEERVEEIRAIRRQLFCGVGTDYRRLRELGMAYPANYRVLRGVKPIARAAEQLARGGDER